MLREIIQFLISRLARHVIRRYKPIVIGVTGSVGKSSAKEAIFTVLSRKFKVARNQGNFNQEIGAPLAVLNITPFYKDGKTTLSRIVFIGRVLSRFWLAFGWPKGKYPKYLVLELAADRPGDIEYLTSIVKPTVGVVTAVGEIPVHVEFYDNPQKVANEKARLVRNLPENGLAVLNYDDETVLDMKSGLKAKTITFGFSEGADVRVSDVTYFGDEETKNISGLFFKVHKGNSFMPMKLKGAIAPHQIYAVLAAAAVGTSMGMNLVDISESLENIEMPPGRMSLKKGIKNSTVIDDSYNASPLATRAALDTLNKFGASFNEITGNKGRKIAVLGDMKELGKFEVMAHQQIGGVAAEKADILVTVGIAAKLMADAAGSRMKKKNIFSFSTSEEAKGKVAEIIKECDIILVKGSRSMKMEEIVKAISS